MIRKPLRPLARILDARARGGDPDAIEASNRAERQAAISAREAVTSRQRMRFLGAFFMLGFATVGVKMTAVAHSVPSEPRAHYTGTQIISQRADITDRRGRVLATNFATHSLYAHPHQMVDPITAARELKKIFPDLDHERLLRDFTTENRKFVWIRKKISPEQLQAVHDIGEPGLLFGPREMRLYPNGRLASHILGGSTFGEEGVSSAEVLGIAGVEKRFDARLRDPGRDGEPLALSIDMTAQSAMEEVLSNGMKVMSAKGAAAVLLKASTGEVIAMASLPDFDPNDRPRPLTSGDAADSPLFNRALQGQYELGSTFKIFPVAQAMDLGLINPRNWINTRSPMRIGKYEINDFHSYGESMSVEDIIVKSSNVGTVRIAQMIGLERQKSFLEELGFFGATPLEVIEAPSARPIVPDRWPAVTAATVSFGHGLAASPLHLAAAYAVLANDGRKVAPTVLRVDGPVEGKKLISEQAADLSLDMLRQVVVRGTARNAEVEGYEVAGKTGTADKPRPGGGYYDNRVLATFAAVFPASEPEYVLVVTLDEPSVNAGAGESRVAGATAVPVAAELIRRIAPVLGLRPVVDSALPVIDAPPAEARKLAARP